MADQEYDPDALDAKEEEDDDSVSQQGICCTCCACCIAAAAAQFALIAQRCIRMPVHAILLQTKAFHS